MIEGLRLLPWRNEVERKAAHTVRHLTDCSKCMETKTREQRQLMACGFEPAHQAARAWCPPIGGIGYSHGIPKTCVGYTAGLPEVNEIAVARLHWNKGELASLTGGEAPSEALLDGIAVLEGESAHARMWAMTPVEEGGGRAS